MGETTEIAWCDATFNIVWGCTKISEACKFCYAEAFSKRVGLKVWGQDADRRIISDAYWKAPLSWNAKAKRSGMRTRVFCSSMADVFEDHSIVESQRVRLWRLIDQTPHLDWLLLTKRPENMTRMVPIEWHREWPSNIWAGTTVENQQRANERIPELLKVPARVRFLSAEPLLEAVTFLPSWLAGYDFSGGYKTRAPRVDWIVVGGESGPGARPFNLAWARSIRDQCKAAGVACFVKQMGAEAYDHALSHRPIPFADRKGGEIQEWPVDLRVREFPQ